MSKKINPNKIKTIKEVIRKTLDAVERITISELEIVRKLEVKK